jgi:hypothetical protein
MLLGLWWLVVSMDACLYVQGCVVLQLVQLV